MNRRKDQTYFSTRFEQDTGRSGVWQEIAAYVSRDFFGSDSILELGPGYCDFINQVGVDKKSAVDVSEVASDHANDDVTMVIGDCADLSFLESDSMQNVFASNVLEHLDRPQLNAVASEVHRVLLPGGRFLLIQPNFRLCYANYFDDYTHVSVFSDISLAGFLQSHEFNIVRCVPDSFRSP